MTLKTMLSCALLCALPLAVQAQELPLWEVGVLGGTASTPAYPGSSDRSTRSLVLPFLIYRGKVFPLGPVGHRLAPAAQRTGGTRRRPGGIAA
ncbi:hypothetical protein LP420_11485 [Massilia sp. B-10]|nr:hypothetical protein LP420_11485 [Massilia sp. B-10]UUZ55916.1 hypothetical protein LP419_10910 [Massilia sp. H-1]